MEDTFRTIAGRELAETREKGSRFIAEAIPVATPEAAAAEIEAIRRREFAATHHCTAYRLGPDGDDFSFNDAGEPRGTAGPPILRQIDALGLTDTLVVVTRYFGGTKLGTGGLVRAYGDAAAAVLARCRIEEHVIRTPVRVRFRYDDTSPAMHTIHLFDAVIADTVYTDETELVVAVRRSQADAFRAAFVDNLAGRGRVVDGG